MHWQPIEEASTDPRQVVDLWIEGHEEGHRITNCHWVDGVGWTGQDFVPLARCLFAWERITHFMVVCAPEEGS